MTKANILEAFEVLGQRLGQLKAGDELLERAYIDNNWFTVNNQLKALAYWHNHLNKVEIDNWLSPYSFTTNPKNVGIITAGNIPLVGLHDVLCGLASGHKISIKLSSSDSRLMQFVINQLIDINPGFSDKIEIVEMLNDVHAVIATGNNSSNAIFEFYFKNIPHLLRKNRNSIAVLTGKETSEELLGLAADIFSYFGLGCRNVSKILVPDQYDFTSFFDAIESFNEVIHHNKYNNNYTYHKAIFLMNLNLHLDSGFLILKEDERLASPLGCLYFSFYKNRNEVLEFIDQHSGEIQAVIGNPSFLPECIAFGESQNPALNEYADGIDTMLFLNQI